MAFRILSEDVYEAAKAYYRQRPGDITGCAAATKLSVQTAGKFWRGPQSQVLPFATPCRELFAAEREAARARAEEVDRSVREQLAAEKEKTQRLETEARQIEDGILRLARSNVVNALGGLAHLSSGIKKLAERVNKQLETGVDAQGNALDIDPGEALRIIQRSTQSTRALVEAANLLIGIERVKKNLPTSIVGIEVSNVSLADAEEQHTLAGEMLERARTLGLVNKPNEQLPVLAAAAASPKNARRGADH